MKPPPVRMDVSREEFEGVLARVRERVEEPDYEKLKAAIETLAYLTDLVQDREISLQRLGTGAAGGHRLPLAEPALQPVRRSLHGRGAAGSGNGEV